MMSEHSRRLGKLLFSAADEYAKVRTDLEAGDVMVAMLYSIVIIAKDNRVDLKLVTDALTQIYHEVPDDPLKEVRQ